MQHSLTRAPNGVGVTQEGETAAPAAVNPISMLAAAALRAHTLAPKPVAVVSVPLRATVWPKQSGQHGSKTQDVSQAQVSSL